MSDAAFNSILIGVCLFAVTFAFVMLPWKKLFTVGQGGSNETAVKDPEPAESGTLGTADPDVADYVAFKKSGQTAPTVLGNKAIYIIAVFGLLGVLAAAWFFSMPAKTDQIARAEDACIWWFKRERELSGAGVFTSDIWEKDGRIVVEVGFDKNSNSYSTRLCVFDPLTGKMQAPNNFTRSRWE